MHCTECGFESPQGARFCAGCGLELAQVCGQCQTPLISGAKFCHQCGASGDTKPETPPDTKPHQEPASVLDDR